MKDDFHAYVIGKKIYRIYDSGLVEEVEGKSHRSITVWELVTLIDGKK